jgi:hypothetical protein
MRVFQKGALVQTGVPTRYIGKTWHGKTYPYDFLMVDDL